MQRILLASALCVATVHAANLSATERQALTDEFNAWKQSRAGQIAIKQGFYKPYISLLDDSVPDTDLARFQNTKTAIEKLSKENPEATFSVNTPFTMMTTEEFAHYVKGSFSKGQPKRQLRADANNNAQEAADTMVDGTDWTNSGCVGAVRDQGQCGSCWAFASVASAESANCLANGHNFVEFSTQQVTNCCTAGGSQGCDGGYEDKAIDWISQNGLCTETSYPYTSGSTGQTGTCKSSCTRQHLAVSGVVNVNSGESNLQNALQKQPITVAVSAGNDAWKQYSGGVLSSCPKAQSDHAVFAVAYGTSSSPYFKIRNSWGTSWGENGYIYLKRGVGGVGTCNVAETPSYPQMSSTTPAPTATSTAKPTSTPKPTATSKPTATPKPTKTPKPTTPAPTTTSPPSDSCNDCTGCYDAEYDYCYQTWSEYTCTDYDLQWCGN